MGEAWSDKLRQTAKVQGSPPWVGFCCMSVYTRISILLSCGSPPCCTQPAPENMRNLREFSWFGRSYCRRHNSPKLASFSCANTIGCNPIPESENWQIGVILTYEQWEDNLEPYNSKKEYVIWPYYSSHFAESKIVGLKGFPKANHQAGKATVRSEWGTPRHIA